MRSKAGITPRKQPKQERSHATVEAVLAATAHILIKDGYEGASTNRIAEAAGVSIGSLYQYFPNKEAIVGVMVDRMIEEERGLIEPRILESRSRPIPELIRDLVTAMMESHHRNPRLRKIIVEQAPRVGRLAKKLDFRAHIIELVEGALKQRRDEILPKDTQTAAYILVHSVDAVILSTLSPNSPRDSQKDSKDLKPPSGIPNDRLIRELSHQAMRYLCRTVED